jgi:N-acetylmuramoyl-L-alanine amidase
VCLDCSIRSANDLPRRRFLRDASLVVGAAATTVWPEWLLAPESAAWAAGPTRLEVICKGAWGGEPAEGRFRRHTVTRLTVHHSGSVFRRNRKAPEQVRSIQAYHQSRGFPDIAYHFIVDRHGNVYKGRPSWARPDSFTGYNTRGHLTVMCLGNFSQQSVPVAQLAALRDVLAWAVTNLDVPIRRIRGHRDYVATACPGNDLYRLVANGSLGRRVRRRIRHGGVDRVRLCGKEGRQRVAAIERGED